MLATPVKADTPVDLSVRRHRVRMRARAREVTEAAAPH